MKNWFKLTVIIFYLIIMSALLDFQLTSLFDPKQLMLVIIGMILLFLPGFHSGESRRYYTDSLGRCALFAGLIQTFIMLFIVLSEEHGEHILKEAAVNLRPLLYGFCLWIILSGSEPDRKKEMSDTENDITKDPESACRKAGLTIRETEITLLLLQNFHNAEIAMQLHISESTVKKHVSNIYAKLEIGRREELKDKLM